MEQQTVTTQDTSTTQAPNTGAVQIQTDWTAGFNDDLKGYISNKGFKDVNSLADSYRNMEKLIGVPQERVLKLPDKEDAPEWQSIYDRLGRPKDVKDYGVKIPEGGNKEFLEGMLKKFHELGMTKKQANEVINSYSTSVEGMMAAQKQQADLTATNAVNTLKQEWGMAYQQNLDKVDQIANKMGWDEKVLNSLKSAFGPLDAIKFIHSLGEKTSFGEDNFHGGKPAGIKTPAGAQQRINDLMSDRDFQTRLFSGDAQAKNEWDALNQQAYSTSN